MVEHLPSAQGVILEFWDRVPHQAPRREPASPSACVSASLSVCLSGINKILKNRKQKNTPPWARAHQEPGALSFPLHLFHVQSIFGRKKKMPWSSSSCQMALLGEGQESKPSPCFHMPPPPWVPRWCTQATSWTLQGVYSLQQLLLPLSYA